MSSIDASDFPTDPFALSDFSKRSAVDYVFDKLVAAIAIGAFSPGDVLPPERELATQLGVSRATLRQAIGQLVGLGRSPPVGVEPAGHLSPNAPGSRLPRTRPDGPSSTACRGWSNCSTTDAWSRA